MMYYGVQYYPEHWPEDRWVKDAAMMERAGVNTVRMGEFAWSALEPEEGRYDFGWLDRAVALLYDHGIKTLMCTCSRTPPPWAFTRYPGIANVSIDGKTMNYGERYTIGLAHPEFVELSQRIDGAVIEHFAGHPAVVGWQIDNEVGGGNDCYCPRCLALFRDYLRAKYGTVEDLNAAWGENFWSFRFTSFDEVPLPGRNPQLALEYRRFMSRTNTQFALWRYRKMKQHDPDKWVTTNFKSFGAKNTDYFELQTAINVNGMNHYPAGSPEFILDYYRGDRDKALVDYACEIASVESVGPGLTSTPDGITAYERRHGDSRLLFLLNFGESRGVVALPGVRQDVFTGEVVAEAEVPPVDIRLLIDTRTRSDQVE